MNLLVSRKRLLGNIGDFLWSYGGYLIVSALCDLCGVVLDESNTRNFVSGCIESLYDTLKTNLSVDGANYSLSLSDELMSEFIEFYKGKEGTLIDGKFEIASPNLDLPFKFPKTQAVWADLCSFKVNQDCQIKPLAFCEGTDSISSLSLYGSYSNFSKGDIVSYKCAWDISGNYFYLVNIYKNGSYVGQAYQGWGSSNPGSKYLDLEFFLRVDASLIDKDTFNSFVGVAYPSVLGDVSTLEEYKVKYENEPTKIVLDSSIANIKTKWKKESTDIYISDGNVENLPNGMNVTYRKYLINDGHINVRWGCGSFVYTDETAGLFSTDENGDKYLNGGYSEIHTVDVIDLTGKTKICLDWIGYNRGVFLYREDSTKIREVPGADIGREWGKRRYTELALGDVGKLGLCKIYIERYSQEDRCVLYKVWLE